jgi:hypothetical protein
MKKRSDDPLDRVPGPIRPEFPLWFASLAPPIAAIGHLQFSYILEHTACSTQTKLQIHIATLIFLALVIAGGVVARREWVRLGAEPPDQLPGRLGAGRFLALIGMIGAAIFGLFILAQWFPNFVLGPCIRT